MKIKDGWACLANMSDHVCESIPTETCHDLEHGLQLIASYKAQRRPLLLKQFWKSFKPDSEFARDPIGFLKMSTHANTLVKLFCHDVAGDFPQKTIENVPLHSFIAEWERRLNNEHQNSSFCNSSSLPASCDMSTLSASLNPPLSSYTDVFLGNCHIKDLSESLLTEIGDSPFELLRTRCSSCSKGAKLGIDNDLVPMTERGRLWMGNSTHISHLHFDAHHGLLITLYGKKIATLYEPLHHLRIIERSKEGNHALKNVLTTPLNASARPLRCEISPGDALFIPLYWWHLVESPESSMAINFWCYPDFDSSLLKFGTLWPFTESLCRDMILNILAQPSHPSRIALISRQHSTAIFERLLRFDLQSVISAESQIQKTEKSTADEDEQSIKNWSELVEEGIRRIRGVISGIQ